MSDEVTTTHEDDHELRHRPRAPIGRGPTGIIRWIGESFWNIVPSQFRHNIWPEIDLLPGEEVQVEIHLAWYRDITSLFVFGYFSWFLALIIIISLLLVFFQQGAIVALIPVLILIIAVGEATREYLEYHQWRLLKTNKRMIISIPQHGAWPLVDNIEMGTLPRIIDTNWSPSFVWKVFQFFTGARDVYISLTGLQFVEGTAKVKDALVIPDIMPEDVFELKRLVFG